jgi:hypothetical protein
VTLAYNNSFFFLLFIFTTFFFNSIKPLIIISIINMTDNERGTGPVASSGDIIIDTIIENFGVEAGITTTDSNHTASSGTPSPLLQLIQAWINERTTPELLPYESQLMTQLEEQLVAQV